VPTCDGSPHTFEVTVPASSDFFSAGSGFGVAKVIVQERDDLFEGVDLHDVDITHG
jgi:hypothetical protein